MKIYEAMILLDNREVKKGWEPLKEAVDSVLTKNGAEIVVAKRWDERKLAYEIKKQRRATYYLTYFKAPTDAITEIRRGLVLAAPVLRHLILCCDEIPAEAYEPEREFDLDKAEAGEGEAAEPEGGEPAEAEAEPEEAVTDDVAGDGDDVSGIDEIADEIADESEKE